VEKWTSGKVKEVSKKCKKCDGRYFPLASPLLHLLFHFSTSLLLYLRGMSISCAALNSVRSHARGVNLITRWGAFDIRSSSRRPLRLSRSESHIIPATVDEARRPTRANRECPCAPVRLTLHSKASERNRVWREPEPVGTAITAFRNHGAVSDSTQGRLRRSRADQGRPRRFV